MAAWLKTMTEPSVERRFSSPQQALKALESSHLPTQSQLVINRPDWSKIQLTKDADSLEILIPPLVFSHRWYLWDYLRSPGILLFYFGL